MKRVILTVVNTLLVIIVAPLIVLAMAMRAPHQENPVAGDSQAIATGLEHYAYIACHESTYVQSRRTS